MKQLTEQTLFANRYQFQRLLGRGGFSEVWLAVDTMTHMEIAVKVYAPGQGMDTDGMKDFCKELSQVYNLNHTNLLKPQHVDNWEGMPYLVMTYCPQGSCHRQIGKMDEEQIWKMLHDVASGLAYLHEQGIIHQDIKPDNILIDPMGHYMITDFGISVQSRSTLRKSMNLASGSGTTAYMGPERFSADPTPLKASDIWSLGATAYELLTGNAPFGEIGGGLQKGGADLPTIKQNISPELRTLLTRMLAKETWDRPTAEQVAHWREHPQDAGSTGTSNPQTPQTNPQTGLAKIIKTNKTWWIAGAVLLVALLTTGITLRHQHKKRDAIEAQEQEFVIRGRGIQLDISKDCDKSIADLNEDNLLDQLDRTIDLIRKLERFETKSEFSPVLKFKMAPDKMKALLGKLTDIRERVDYSLRTELADFDKKGKTYQNALRKIKRIDAVFEDIQTSPNKSAQDIHISSDDF